MLEKPWLPGCIAVISKTMAASLERIQIMSSWYGALYTISQYKHWNAVLNLDAQLATKQWWLLRLCDNRAFRLPSSEHTHFNWMEKLLPFHWKINKYFVNAAEILILISKF
jgi:hypothetical protein